MVLTLNKLFILGPELTLSNRRKNKNLSCSQSLWESEGLMTKE